MRNLCGGTLITQSMTLQLGGSLSCRWDIEGVVGTLRMESFVPTGADHGQPSQLSIRHLHYVGDSAELKSP